MTLSRFGYIQSCVAKKENYLQTRNTPDETEKNYEPGCGRLKIKRTLREKRTKEKRKDHREFQT